LEDFPTLIFVHNPRERGALAEVAHLFAVFNQAFLELRDWQTQEALPLLRPSVIHWTFDRKPSTDPLARSIQQLDIQSLSYEAVQSNAAQLGGSVSVRSTIRGLSMRSSHAIYLRKLSRR
jgi:hypothetical protein